jgi:regulation of enolase protein 1 (concanavalin A-like superfamily)
LTHGLGRAASLLSLVCLAGCGSTTHAPMPPDRGGPDDSDAAVVERRDGAAVSRDGSPRDLPVSSAINGPLAPWTARAVGAPPPAGDVRSNTGVMVVRAGGAEVNGTADSFQWVSQKVRGDFDLLGRVRSLQLADPESKAGLMVRAGDEPGAANVFLAVLADPMKGGLLQSRAAAGGPTSPGGMDTGVRAGAWLRLTRRGRTFTGYRSAARLVWTKVGSVDLDLPPELSAGVAVSARSATATTVAEIDALRLAAFEGATRDWSLEEMTGMGASAQGTGTGLALSGLGDTPSLLTDSGTFAYQSASGNQALTVRVASFSHPEPFARVALMIREGPPVLFARTQPSVILSVTAGLGVQFQSRAANNTMAHVVPVKEGVKAPIWLRLERIEVPLPVGSRFTGSYSTDGITWMVVGSTSFPLPEPYLIGVMANSNGSTTPAAATLTDLSLGAATTPPPPPPVDAARPDAPRPDAGSGG